MSKAKKEKGKQLIVRIMALILVGIMIMGVVVGALFSAFAEDSAYPTVDLKIAIPENDTSLFVTETVNYINNTGKSLDRVLFSCYANAFKRETALNYDGDYIENAFPAGYAPSGIIIYGVYVNGTAADWGYQGTDECFLRV